MSLLVIVLGVVKSRPFQIEPKGEAATVTASAATSSTTGESMIMPFHYQKAHSPTHVPQECRRDAGLPVLDAMRSAGRHGVAQTGLHNNSRGSSAFLSARHGAGTLEPSVRGAFREAAIHPRVARRSQENTTVQTGLVAVAERRKVPRAPITGSPQPI